MESSAPPKKRKKFYQSDFLTRRSLYFATLLFLVFQLVKLIRLFSDAVAYKKINQVVPENFTMAAVTGAVIMIGLMAWVVLILTRQRRNISRLRRGNRFLLLDTLLAAYGLVRLIAQAVLFFQNFEILFLLDIIAIAGGLIAPPLILFLADRQRIPPGDVLLLIIGAGTIGMSVLGFIMVAISIGKDYTVVHALPELAFRLGVALAGLAALMTALKLRAELPIDMPLAEGKIKSEKPKKKKKKRKALHFALLDNLPGYEDEEPEIQLFDDEDDPDVDDELSGDDGDDEPPFDCDDDDGDEPLELPAPPPPRPEVRTPVDDTGRAACLGCGKRFPAYLGVCPHCGLDMDTPVPDEAEELTPAPAPVFVPPAPRQRSADNRAVCPHCGRRYPRYLGVCPHCGREAAGK